MIISQINKFCAKHGRITYLFIGIVIIIPFVFLYGDFGNTWSSNSGRNPVIGEMNGQPITRSDFLNQLNAVKLNIYLDYQKYVGAINDEIIQLLSKDILNRIRALHKAKDLKIDRVTEEEIKDRITTYPVFLKDNSFDKSKFTDFKNKFLQAQGISANEFDEIIRDNIVISRIEKRVTEAITVTETEARASYTENFTKCLAYTQSVPYYKFVNEIQVSIEEVEKHFTKNLEDKYRVPDEKNLVVAVFDSNIYLSSPEITVADMQNYYEANLKDQYKKNQINLRHVLMRNSSDTPEAEKEKKRNLIGDLHQSLSEGKPFEEVAKDSSEDTVSARKGGEIGFIDSDKIKNRYGEDVFAAATELEAGQLSDVLQSNLGYQIIQKIDERKIIPYIEVEKDIKRILEDERDELRAKKQYEQNKETDYSKEEVHARHILVKFSPEDTDEVKTEKREKLTKLLEEAREKNNFYELAKLHSEDPSNAPKGGDLGYFGKGRMVKEFEETAFSMNKGDISDIVETQFGYHIIEKLDERNQQPFVEVKADIIRKLKKEEKDQAKATTEDEATKFAIALHSSFRNVDSENKSDAFIEFCNSYTDGKIPRFKH